MGEVGSRPEFDVNSGSGRVGSLHLWVGLSRVKKVGPTSNSGGILGRLLFNWGRGGDVLTRCRLTSRRLRVFAPQKQWFVTVSRCLLWNFSCPFVLFCCLVMFAVVGVLLLSFGVFTAWRIAERGISRRRNICLSVHAVRQRLVMCQNGETYH